MANIIRIEVQEIWEGSVLEVTDQEMEVHLRNILDPADPEMTATMNLSEVLPEDRELVQKGAVFYWVTAANGEEVGYSGIRFLRLAPWTQEEINNFQEQTSEFDKLFDKDN